MLQTHWTALLTGGTMYCYKPRNFPASLSRTHRLSLYFYCLSPSQLGHKLHSTRGKNTGSTCLNMHGVVPHVLFPSCSVCTGARFLPSHCPVHLGHTVFSGWQSVNKVKFKISTMSTRALHHKVRLGEWKSFPKEGTRK